MRIGILTKTTGQSPELIRHYEKIGLLDKAGRSMSDQRIYTQDHLDQLKIIKQLRSLDFNLKEIELLFKFQARSTDHTRKEVKNLVSNHISKLDELLENTRRTRNYLLKLNNMCDGSDGPARHCPILEDLSTDKAD